MRPIVHLLLAAAAFSGASGAPPQTKQTPPPAQKKTAPAAKGKTPTAKKSTPSRKKGSRYARRPARQSQPTPDRYREIQQALAAKGYLQSEPSGVWGNDSVEALKRFQQDQNLSPNGKLDSLSLIALGLGPKRSTGSEARTDPR
jgi:hypothetical protein